jgi:hypothetical protein
MNCGYIPSERIALRDLSKTAEKNLNLLEDASFFGMLNVVVDPE